MNRKVIRQYARHLAAIAGLVVLAGVIAGYILVNQRLRLPWDERYELSAEISTAAAITPGQGQTVTVSGVKVGDISKVELQDGHAVVRMDIDPDKLPAVYGNATALVRPRTPLGDQTIELDPGTAKGGRKLGDGATIQIEDTLPNVNLDDVLTSLDADTRSYLTILVNAGAGGLQGRADDLRKAFGSAEPLLASTRRITDALADRRRETRRLVRNLNVLSTSLAGKDDSIRRLVSASRATFGALAQEETALGTSVQKLPGTLNEADRALAALRPFARELRPTLSRLSPTARKLTPALSDVRPLLEQGPSDLVKIRELAVAARPVVRDARPALKNLDAATPDLTRAFDQLRYVTNELAFVPKGPDKSMLFWLAWFANNTNSFFSTGDAHGAVWRLAAMFSCDQLTGATLNITSPQLQALLKQAGLCQAAP